MPFVDEEKSAEIYKEMDKEIKSSIYFKSLYIELSLLWVIFQQKMRLAFKKELVKLGHLNLRITSH